MNRIFTMTFCLSPFLVLTGCITALKT